MQSSKQVGRVPWTLHSCRPLRNDWLQGQINMQINQQGAALPLALEGIVFKIHYDFIVVEITWSKLATLAPGNCSLRASLIS